MELDSNYSAYLCQSSNPDLHHVSDHHESLSSGSETEKEAMHFIKC